MNWLLDMISIIFLLLSIFFILFAVYFTIFFFSLLYNGLPFLPYTHSKLLIIIKYLLIKFTRNRFNCSFRFNTIMFFFYMHIKSCICTIVFFTLFVTTNELFYNLFFYLLLSFCFRWRFIIRNKIWFLLWNMNLIIKNLWLIRLIWVSICFRHKIFFRDLFLYIL